MKKSRYLIELSVCAYIICCLAGRFSEIKAEILGSMNMWVSVLIPSLFPYLVISQYVVSSGMLGIFRHLKKFIKKIFNLSDCGADVYLCSLISGYPTGAICTANLYNSGSIDKEEAQRLVCFTNNSGPLFLISAVGSCMLGCTKDGIAIYAVQTIAAAATGIMLGIGKKMPYCNTAQLRLDKKPLTQCCNSSVNTILIIGGYLIVASVVGRVTMMAIEKLPFYNVGNKSLYECGVYFIFEITSCMSRLAVYGHSRLGFAFICAAASWAGVSVMMQIKGCLPEGFSFKAIVASRAFQSVISFCLGYTFRAMTDSCFSCVDSAMAIEISLVMCLIIFICCIFASKLKKQAEPAPMSRAEYD